MKSLVSTALLAATIAASIPSFAETIHDRRTWFNLTGQGRIANSHCRWYFDVQERNRNGGSDADQFVARPGIGYALNEAWTVWVGYAYTANFRPTGGVLDENRPWEQFVWSRKAGRGTVSSRSRLEQRFFEGTEGIGWRAREQVRLLYP